MKQLTPQQAIKKILLTADPDNKNIKISKNKLSKLLGVNKTMPAKWEKKDILTMRADVANTIFAEFGIEILPEYINGNKPG